MSKKALVSFFFERNYMISPSVIKLLTDDFNYDFFLEKNSNLGRSEDSIVLDETLFKKLIPQIEEVKDNITTKVEIVSSYEDKYKKREVKDFVTYFKLRYNSLKKILLKRGELQGAISIRRVSTKEKGEPVSIIGFVSAKDQTKNGHYILELEDPSGTTKVLISAKNKDLMPLMDEIVLDEMIGISGSVGENIVFSNKLFFPDMTLREYKKCKDDVSVVFLSDLHIGSDLFAKKEFERFVEWINLRHGTEDQIEIARKVKYIVIPGDLIEGVGIYPGQEKDLLIKDVYKQYEEVAKYFESLRKDVKIIICAGNHEALRLAEPQPPIDKDFGKSIHKLKNVTCVSNPGMVRIHGMFDVLLYHGSGFDYYVNNNQFLRDQGSYENQMATMEFFLKKRHFAPMHMSSLYIPDIQEDFMVIENLPDFFVSGHTHYEAKIGNYKNVCLIGASSFQYPTSYQEKLGHTNIAWGQIAIINLKTRMSKIIDFRD
jgi:DNA polymerase II small subunit